MLLQGPDTTRLSLGTFPNHSVEHAAKVRVQHVSFWYGAKRALFDVNLDIFRNEVTAFIGPSGCGKSTLLRCLNRMNDGVPGARLEGRILVDDLDIHDPTVDPPRLRRRMGWIAQRPNPFERSIRKNILYAPRILGLAFGAAEEEALVERALRSVGLWEEVKDRLEDAALRLSIGQQQRLCIARAVAVEPEIILMDEPCSALDPVSTAHVEQLIDELRAEHTIVIITHNLQQAARIAQRAAFFHLGELLEAGDAEQVFLNPQNERSQDYITGRYG